MTRMKDSGNPWVREIPSDWFEKKLRYLVKLRGEKSVTTDYKKYVGLENIMSQTGQYVQTGIEVDLTENLTFEVGDILFGKLRPYLRKYWRAEFSGTASSEFVIIKGSSLNLNFLFWAIQSDSFINDVDSSTYGSKMPRASWEYMKNIKLPFPESIEEQTQIADFLDKKVAQLDKVKSLLEEQIKTLEDYRQSLIYETVTKGLDKTVPLKDSGVDWIGQIPEGWGITKFKYFLDTNKGLTITKENLIEDGIPVINYGQIHSKYGKSVNTDRDELPQVSANYLKFKQSLLKPGDFVFADTSEDIDGSGNFSTRTDDNGELFAGYHTIKAKLKNALEHDFRYFMHYFDSLAFRKQVQNKVSGIKVYSITQSILQETCLILPSLYEQQQIATFLDKKTEQINQMIAIKKEQIENINKQRQTLIYDYVTGKRRV
ncbi:restriction endonuclease subunit S [Streptococcus parasuis]|uniref:restriction endonuclease subunit S n=1 Tax=Streptococcus parasuis TaxID=1501662 RepID=UPI00289B7C3C|nr:restriction endonuclease subunit S [Streptococcus parasuis]